MKRWPTKPLGEVCEFVRGISFKPTDLVEAGSADSLACFRTKNVQVALEVDDLIHIPRSFVKTDRQLVQESDTLISTANSSNLVGKCCFVPRLDYPATLGGFIAAVRSDPKQMQPRFVYYWLTSPPIQAKLRGRARQTTNISNLPLTDVAKESMPVPSLAEQERIVKLLDEVDELRKLRAQADRHTATLISALFHEMFGPDAPDSNTWETATVAELAAAHEGSIRTGPFGSDLRHSEFIEEGVPVLGIDNVVSNEFRWTKSRCIPEAKFAEMKRFVVFPADVLVTIMGTVGRCSVAPDDLPVCISTKHLCAVTLDRTKVHPRFIWGAFLHDPSVKQQTLSVGKGAIMEGWNSTIIKRLKLRVPPLPLQEEFAARVSEIRAMQAEQAASRRRLDDLFQSILHRAFRGEL